jgi:hypothetical protein
MRGAILEVQALPKISRCFRSARSRDAALVVGLLGACAATGAQAQAIASDDAAISVQKRPRPDLDPVPIRFGAIEALPTARLRIAFDDNVYAARTDKIDDALVTLSTGVAAHSTWSRHAVSLNAEAALARGLSQENEDTQTWDVQAGTRLDIGADARASFSAGYSRAYEPRGSVGDTTLRGPRIAYNTLELGAQVQRNAGRLILEAEASLDTFRYAPYRAIGTAIGQGDRDYRTWSATLRAGYAMGPGIAAFVDGSYNQARYPDGTTSLDRSSDGYSLRGGIQFGLTRLIRGRAAIGYQNQRYDDDAFPRIKGLDFGAALEWNPTQLVTWSLEAKRTIQRSPLVGVAGIRQSRYATRIDYEARRNVILSARLEQTVSDYAGTDRIQKDLSATLGADWLLSRSLRVSAQGGFQRTRSDGVGGRRFDRRRVSVSLRYAL